MNEEIATNYVKATSLGWSISPVSKGGEYWWEAVRNDETIRSQGFRGTFMVVSWLRDLDVLLRKIKS